MNEENNDVMVEARESYSYGEAMIESPKRTITIDPLNYGYVVRVGCQNCAIESKEDLIKYLTEYINNPEEAEQKYNRRELLKHQSPIKTK